MRLFRVFGSAELGEVASCSALECLWLGIRKVGSQVIGKGQCQLFGGETVGEVRRGGRRGRRTSDRVKKRVYIFRVGFG